MNRVFRRSTTSSSDDADLNQTPTRTTIKDIIQELEESHRDTALEMIRKTRMAIKSENSLKTSSRMLTKQESRIQRELCTLQLHTDEEESRGDMLATTKIWFADIRNNAAARATANKEDATKGARLAARRLLEGVGPQPIKRLIRVLADVDRTGERKILHILDMDADMLADHQDFNGNYKSMIQGPVTGETITRAARLLSRLGTGRRENTGLNEGTFTQAIGCLRAAMAEHDNTNPPSPTGNTSAPTRRSSGFNMSDDEMDEIIRQTQVPSGTQELEGDAINLMDALRNQNIPKTSLTEPIDEGESHRCKICKRQFTRLNLASNHMTTHRKELMKFGIQLY
jgi:hypothetical protein